MNWIELKGVSDGEKELQEVVVKELKEKCTRFVPVINSSQKLIL